MQINALKGFGFEITDVDLAVAGDEAFKTIFEAFSDSGLVFFRDQQLSETEHIAFAKRFGDININRFFAAHPDYPEIALVTKEPDQTANIGLLWHTDHSYDEIPALGSILLAREVPPTGGDTCFASMYHAYDKLSHGLQKTLEGMSAVHSAKHVFGSIVNKVSAGRIGNAKAADVLTDPVHPVVIKHPLSGRKALYVNPQFTLRFEGWSEAESRPLLDYLYELARDGKDVCQFHWEVGSIAVWDNRATWHSARNDYHGHRRFMHRITVEGCALQAASG